MQTPWQPAAPLDSALFEEVRRKAIFDCCKWDTQVEDVATLADFPLVMRATAWNELCALAEQLAEETVAAEGEIRRKTRLHQKLGLPRAIRRVLRKCPDADGSLEPLRVMRFDFHFTTEGWRISEANTDVPGGFNEASGFTALMANHFGTAEASGDPVARLVDAIARATGPDGVVALVHATAFTDDRQVMVFLAHQLERRGLRAWLVGPDHLRWREGRVFIESDWCSEPVDFVFRFFPAEWLPDLPRRCGWAHFFHGAQTPLCNPATALLTQSKRFPLVWDSLETDLPTWRTLLPETHDPRDVDWRTSHGWVLKPAFGRVGELIGFPGVTAEKDWELIRRGARWHAGHWVAQRRFEAVPVKTDRGSYFPCIGVYTIDGTAAGAYGRIARHPVINHCAQDIAVLVDRGAIDECEPEPELNLANELVRTI